MKLGGILRRAQLEKLQMNRAWQGRALMARVMLEFIDSHLVPWWLGLRQTLCGCKLVIAEKPGS